MLSSVKQSLQFEKKIMERIEKMTKKAKVVMLNFSFAIANFDNASRGPTKCKSLIFIIDFNKAQEYALWVFPEQLHYWIWFALVNWKFCFVMKIAQAKDLI